MELVPPRGKAGGILVGVSGDVFLVEQVEIGEYFVRVLVCDKIAKFKWNLIAVYGDAQVAGKTAFLSELSRMYQNNHLPYLVGGDFDIIRKRSEKNKANTTNHWSFVFNAIIEHARLRELTLPDKQYTWANNLEDPTFEKLDRVLFCSELEEHYPLAFLSSMARDLSDHTPLIVDTGECSSKTPIF